MNLQEFNAAFPSGSDVIYTDDFGKEHATKTRSEAWALGHGGVVVLLEGRSGGYDIDRIKAAPTETKEERAFTDSEILGGYAFKSYEKELSAYNFKRYNEIVESGAQIELKKTPAYGRGMFTGKLLNDAAKSLTTADIAIYADHGNLCFGGSCKRSGDSFSGCYFTD